MDAFKSDKPHRTPSKLPESEPLPSTGDAVVCKLSIPLPKGQGYVEQVSTAFPEALLQVSGFLVVGQEVVLDLEVTRSPNLGEVLSLIRNSPDVLSCEVLRRDMGAITTRVRSILPKVSAIRVQTSLGLIPNFPVQIQEGKLTLVVAASGEKIRALLSELRAKFPKVDLTSIRKERLEREVGLLTQHQLDIFHRALASGYWDIPRRTTLSDLATGLQVAKSTLSETLALIENRLIHEMADKVSPASTLSDRTLR